MKESVRKPKRPWLVGVCVAAIAVAYILLLAKDRFLSLYLRYALAHLEPFRLETSDIERKSKRDELDNYILKHIAEADKSESIVKVGKGQGKQTVVSFPDETKWTVPPAFKAAVKE